MSVVGIGTDIVEVSRVEQMSDAARLRLAKRVLTPTEFPTFEKHNFPHTYLAKRWAAKEAASKALGTGIAQGISFQHFQIDNDSLGKPELILSGEALKKAQSLGASHWHISISDEKHYALAFVVLSK